MMKQLAARLLVFLCIISFTPMKEVIKSPLIVIHYLDHLDESPEMTWDEFYFLHYTIDIHFDDDYAQDRQLPFKTFEYSQLPVFVVSEYPLNQIKECSYDFDFKSTLNSIYHFAVKDAKLHGVFHPPRIV